MRKFKVFLPSVLAIIVGCALTMCSNDQARRGNNYASNNTISVSSLANDIHVKVKELGKYK